MCDPFRYFSTCQALWLMLCYVFTWQLHGRLHERPIEHAQHHQLHVCFNVLVLACTPVLSLDPFTDFVKG